MEIVNAEQIKTNIEACIERECENCSYCEQTACKETMLCDTLALINSQEQRIGELAEENAEVKGNWQKLKDSYDNNDKEWREAYADSQSKWEKAYEKLELTLEGVMHFVDKWLDGAELEYDEVNRAITMREKTLQIVEIERLAEENERLRAEEHWISVKDKLPDNYRAVLVVCESTSISGGRLRAVGSYGGGFWSMADADGTMRLTKYMQYVVTHWMELPQMPNRKIDQIAKEMLEGEK